MYKGNSIAVVVPAYNEEGFVGDVIETTPEFVDRIYPVDDGSTDGTWEEIRAAARRVNGDPAPDGGVGAEVSPVTSKAAYRPRVVPIQHEANRGVGGAIKTGYVHAREDGMDVTAVLGGDRQMDPDELPRLLDPIVEGEADYAKGNRLATEESRTEMPRFRYVGNHLLSGLTKVASGYWEVGDPQNGYTAISLKALETVPIEEMYEFYGYCNDLLVKLNTAQLRVAEVPMAPAYGDEESHIRYRSYVPRVSGMLFRSFLGRLAAEITEHGNYVRPAAYVVGPVLTFLGLLGVVFGFAAPSTVAMLPFGRSGGLLVLGLGWLCLYTAILLDIRHNEGLVVSADPERGASTDRVTGA